MADATVFTPDEQHGLRHDFVELHRVMPCATGHHEHRNTEVLKGVFPTVLPLDRAGCGRHAKRALCLAHQPAALTNGLNGLQDIALQGIALRIVGRAQVEGKNTPTRHHIDRTAGHLKLSDGGNRISIGSRTLFHEKRQFRNSTHRVMAPVHGRSPRMAGHTHHLA